MKDLTAKEKAKELVDQMYTAHSNSASDITFYFAKQCALISIKEILNIVPLVNRDYYQDVKSEIEKL